MAAETPPTQPAPRLKSRYEGDIRPALMDRFGYTNIWEVPRLVKVSVNMGVSDGKEDIKNLEQAIKELAMIIGQRACIRRARKSIAAFGLRAGMAVGCKATLRGVRMYEFVDRLFNVCLPRIRDFRGLSPHAFDGRGSYTIGIKDHLIFPELGYDDVAKTRGMDITIVTTAKTDEEAAALLREMGLPLAAA
ncbi:MAG: 50S ribosomal protein L5 [Armatimonadetes bacterium]|nr:50S ribosomal protein L5 [Armatimonadota bacterium]